MCFHGNIWLSVMQWIPIFTKILLTFSNPFSSHCQWDVMRYLTIKVNVYICTYCTIKRVGTIEYHQILSYNVLTYQKEKCLNIEENLNFGYKKCNKNTWNRHMYTLFITQTYTLPKQMKFGYNKDYIRHFNAQNMQKDLHY